MSKITINAIFITLGLFSFSIEAKIEAIIGSAPFENNKNLIGIAPTTNASEIIISRDQYVVSYNKNNRSPNWVAWKLDNQSFGPVKRTNSFSADNDLQTYFNKQNSNLKAVSPNEYTGSCFDRGHQTPSADRTNSENDNRATFLMSNMAPQTPYLNRVIWEHLESYTRNVIKGQNKVAYIITGPIFDEDFGAIGPNKDIKVPSKEFKIIFFLDQNQTTKDISYNTPSIAVIMPNVLKDGSKPIYNGNGCVPLVSETDEEPVVPQNDWEVYKTDISSIEQAAHIKILAN